MPYPTQCVLTHRTIVRGLARINNQVKALGDWAHKSGNHLTQPSAAQRHRMIPVRAI